MGNLAPAGKLIIIAGIVLVVMGVLIAYGQKIPFLGKLPGDIYIKRENFRFYFPLTTCIILSIILSLVFFIISRFK
ncbi:MAG: DUF2905 domain-containing protein [Spirochaetota bacterium]